MSSDPNNYVIVPKERLSHDALVGLVDAFVLREGTDYGHTERTLEAKREQVLAQLDRGDVVIVFDPDTESANLMMQRDLESEGD